MKKITSFVLFLIVILVGSSSCTMIGRRYSRGFFLHMSVLGAQRIKQKTMDLPKKKVAFPVITKIIADLKIRNMSYAEAQSVIRSEEIMTKRFIEKKNASKIAKEKKQEAVTEQKNNPAELCVDHFSNEISKNTSSASFLNSSAKIVASGNDHKMDNWYKLAAWFIAAGLVWELWLSKSFKN